MPVPYDTSLRLLLALARSNQEINPLKRAVLYQEAGALIAAAREHFTRKDGRTDWAGASWEYRQWIRLVYRTAVSERDRLKVQAAVRWHTIQAVHERLNDDELADAGLLPTTPNERAKARRA